MMGRIKGGAIRLGWHGGRTSDVGPVSAIHGWLMMACDDLKFVCYVCMMNSFVHAPPRGFKAKHSYMLFAELILLEDATWVRHLRGIGD
jgi:hypothetical protein